MKKKFSNLFENFSDFGNNNGAVFFFFFWNTRYFHKVINRNTTGLEFPGIASILVKFRLKRKKKQLDFNVCTVLFTDNIFKNYLWKKTWPSTSFKTRDWAFPPLDRALEAFEENQNLSWEFKKLDRVFKKLVCVFML